MSQEIIRKYAEFPDGIIKRIAYTYNTVEVEMYCGNSENDFKYETILIKFNEIQEFIMKSIGSSATFAPSEVFIKINDGIILFDFDPIYPIDSLGENPESQFKIKCKEVLYTVVKA